MSGLDRALTTVALSALVVALTGCMVGPKYKTPLVPLPDTFVQQDSAAQLDNPAKIAEWWQGFGDTELTSLIRRAVSQSLIVKNAAARLREARAMWRYTTDSQQLPAVATTGEFTRQRTSQDNPAIPKLGNAVNAGNSGLSNFPLIPTEYGVYQAYFDASYELDLWGAARHSMRASYDEAQSFEDSLRGKLVSTIGEVARDYMRLRQYQQQIINAQSNLDTERETPAR